MVIFLEFGFLFPMIYREYKIWQELKFEITFDFMEKSTFIAKFQKLIFKYY